MRHGRRWWAWSNRGEVARLPIWAGIHPALREAVTRRLLRRGFFGTPDDAFYATVIPTMSCDLGCGYCFQNVGPARGDGHRPPRLPAVSMTPETVSQTARFVAAQAAHQRKTSARLCLFGGEPLLRPDICAALLDETAALLPVGASLITNGTHLSPDVARQLAERGLRTVQVTFDGPREVHDRLRVRRRDGLGTFDHILRNVRDSAQAVPDLRWGLRVNAGPDAITWLRALVWQLAEAAPLARSSLSIMPIDDIGVGFAGPSGISSDLARAAHDAYRLAWDIGFSIHPRPQRCNYCSEVGGAGGAVVNADGRLYSCWDSAGRPSLCVGDVRRGYAEASVCARRWRSCGYLSKGPPPAELRWLDRKVVELWIERAENTRRTGAAC